MPVINYLAVIVSAIAMMIIGAIWYGPLFGKLWMEGMGWNQNDAQFMENMKKSAQQAYTQMFIGALIKSFVLAHVLWAFSKAMPATTGISAGLQGGFWIWFGFVLPLKYGDKLWGRKKFKFVSVDLGYELVVLLIAGLILALWK